MRPLYFFLLPLCACMPSVAQQVQNVAQKPSSLVQPAIDSVARAGSAVDLNRWKGSKAAREEVDGYLASMQKDLENTLPPLLSAADGDPDSTAASLPVLLNLDALYSVLLRVTLAARAGAPRDESVSLEQSATLLDSARRDLGDAILLSARAQEKRTANLEVEVQRETAALAGAQQSAQSAGTPPKKAKAAKSRPPSTKTP